MIKESKLTYYTIPLETIEIMIKSLHKCSFVDLETGGDLCVENGKREILIENECVGNKCDIIHKGECSKGRQIVGTFHNHPESIVASPSIRDFLTTYAYGISCIGSVENNNIICYERIGDFIEKNFRTILKADKEIGEILMEHEKLSDEEFRKYQLSEQDVIDVMKNKLFKSYTLYEGET